jgi:hypothetical protein
MCDHLTGGKRSACGASGACPRSEVRPTGPISAGAPGAATRILWVHQCNRTVALQATPARMRPSPGGQIQLDKRVDRNEFEFHEDGDRCSRNVLHLHSRLLIPGETDRRLRWFMRAFASTAHELAFLALRTKT